MNMCYKKRGFISVNYVNGKSNEKVILTDRLRGTISNNEIVKGRRIRSCPDELDLDYGNFDLSRFRTSDTTFRRRRRTRPGHLSLRRTDVDVVSGVDNGVAAVYPDESAGTWVRTGGEDVRDA